MIAETLYLARSASEVIAAQSDRLISSMLCQAADAIEANTRYILKANEEDLFRMDPESPKYDRLRLTRERIVGIAADMRSVALLPSPLNRTLAEHDHPNGMHIRKVSVPFGVIGIIYEARPNVTADVFGLCLKSGNVPVLKGGGDADATNRAIVAVIHDVLTLCGLPREACTLLAPTHEATEELLHAEGLVDLIIPRGSASLIEFVRKSATVPVIETGAGVCHIYFDSEGKAKVATEIVYNAKTRRVSVCNALDCLLVARDRLGEVGEVCRSLAQKNVIIYADDESYTALEGSYPADLLQHSAERDYGREFLDYKMSIRTVADVSEAIAFIAQHGSHHSECIVTENRATADLFLRKVDAACVYENVSTAFTDGGQFGFGAEIGISTQKLHARGPMGLQELTTYKYLISGSGQVRW